MLRIGHVSRMKVSMITQVRVVEGRTPGLGQCALCRGDPPAMFAQSGQDEHMTAYIIPNYISCLADLYLISPRSFL